MRDFVVDFTLPEDDDLFVHHGVNVYAKNAKVAECAPSFVPFNLTRARARAFSRVRVCV